MTAFTMKKSIFAYVLTAGLTIAGGAAMAATPCPPGLIRNQIFKGDVNVVSGNVVSGPNCILLEGVIVTGNVTVQNGASLYMDSGANINGNLKVKDQGELKMYHSTVGNDLQTTGASVVEVTTSIIGNNLQVSKTNSSDQITIRDNTIHNDAQINENTTSHRYGITIYNNNIGNNLQCSKNTPPPTDNDIPNTAKSKQGQCSWL